MRQNAWFIKVRGSYLPASWQAWLLYIPYTAYVVGVIAYAFRHDTDVWTALFTILPNQVAALVIMSWIAERTSKRS